MTKLLRLSTLFYALFTLLALPGCVTSADSNSESGFLWEATRGTQRLTLLGTMHIGISETDIPPLLWQRFQDADKVIIESDVSEMNPRLASRFLTLPPGKNLETLLGPKAWSELLGIFKRVYPELSPAQLSQQSTALTASQLMMAAATEASPSAALGGQSSMDQLIYEKAKSTGKATATLETLEEQLSLLKQAFTPEQLQDLIANYEDEKKQFKELEKSYREGRNQVIASLIADMPPAMRSLLLDQRNLRWSQSLSSLLSPRHTVLAVGAAHFGGEQSLLKLLSAQGFAIRPL